MHNPIQESAISGPINLLKHYSFESNHQSYERVIDSWLGRFPLDWVNLALIESLYQGRYKVVSVEQILTLWQRRGKPSHHFNNDFERLVSNNLPQAFEKKGAKLPRKTLHSRLNTPQNSRPVTSPPIVTYFNGSLGRPKVPSSSPLSDSSRDIRLPQKPAQVSESSEDGDQNPVLHNPSVTSETDLEVTNPPTMKLEATPTLTESTDHFEQDLVDASSKELLADHSNSSSSVSLSAPVGEMLTPIDQFVPQSSSTGFCSKLTAMAQVNV